MRDPAPLLLFCLSFRRPNAKDVGRSSEAVGRNVDPQSALSLPVKSALCSPSPAVIGFGLGTAHFGKTGPDGVSRDVVDTVKTALKVGYTHLDSAEA